jgi:hypothetical protein
MEFLWVDLKIRMIMKKPVEQEPAKKVTSKSIDTPTPPQVMDPSKQPAEKKNNKITNSRQVITNQDDQQKLTPNEEL